MKLVALALVLIGCGGEVEMAQETCPSRDNLTGSVTVIELAADPANSSECAGLASYSVGERLAVAYKPATGTLVTTTAEQQADAMCIYHWKWALTYSSCRWTMITEARTPTGAP